MPWIEWYNSLAKPSWTPAPSTIGPIWQVLYPVIIVSFGFVVVQAFRRKVPWFVALPFAINLVAIAKDVDRRLEQHNAGTASRYTRSRLPATLECQEEQPNQSLALKRELAIKAMSRKAKEALIRLQQRG